jgi:hypothetical protein
MSLQSLLLLLEAANASVVVKIAGDDVIRIRIRATVIAVAAAPLPPPIPTAIVTFEVKTNLAT